MGINSVGPRSHGKKPLRLRRKPNATPELKGDSYEDHHQLARSRGTAGRHQHRCCPSASHKSADAFRGRDACRGLGTLTVRPLSQTRGRLRPRICAIFLRLPPNKFLQVPQDLCSPCRLNSMRTTRFRPPIFGNLQLPKQLILDRQSALLGSARRYSTDHPSQNRRRVHPKICNLTTRSR
jgi:hypothetical protein